MVDWSVLIAFIVYFIVVLWIGFYFYKRSETLSDYLIGNRSLNPYVAALSAQASDMSGWLLMGLPGAIFLGGMSEVWIGIGLAVGAYLSWLVIAKRLRQYTKVSGNSITLPQFFENRFRDRKGLLRFISSAVILVFFTIYVASGFVAGGNVFKAIFPGIDYKIAMLIGVLIIVGYTFTGGFHAVCWTDFFQGMLMVVAIVIVPLSAIGLLGGVDQTVQLANNVGPGFLSLFHSIDGTAISLVVIISSLAWGLGYLGMPHILVRFMAVKQVKMIKSSRRIATTWVIISLAFACILGLVGRLYLAPGTFTDAAGAQTIFIMMAGRIFPPVVAGILYSAIMAAIMSTADSQLLVSSSAITNDIYLKVAKKQPSEKLLLWMGRISVLVIAVIGALMALDEKSSIMALVKYAWGGFGAAFGPVILMALFWKRMNRAGAFAGILTGFLTIILWNNFFAGPTGLYELVPGFAFALIAVIIVSLLSKKPSKEIEEEFELAKQCEE